MAKIEHLDLWEPIEQMNHCSFSDHDLEVQAKLRIRLQNHLRKNLENFIEQDFTLAALQEIIEKYDLGVSLIDQFHFIQISKKLDKMNSLAQLEKSLVERFPLHHHPWAIGQLCKTDPEKIKQLIQRQTNWEEACQGPFKKWFESRDWSRLVFLISKDTQTIMDFIPQRLQRDEVIRQTLPFSQRLKWDFRNFIFAIRKWWLA